MGCCGQSSKVNEYRCDVLNTVADKIIRAVNISSYLSFVNCSVANFHSSLPVSPVHLHHVIPTKLHTSITPIVAKCLGAVFATDIVHCAPLLITPTILEGSFETKICTLFDVKDSQGAAR